MSECNEGSKIVAIFISKKGMATKAFTKYIKEGNIKAIQKQIKKGTVQCQSQ